MSWTRRRDLPVTQNTCDIYQGGLIVLSTGALSAIHFLQTSDVTEAAAERALWVAFSALALLSLFAVAMIAAGIRAWGNYTQEESALLDRLKIDQRPANRTSIWAWYETYLMFSIGVVLSVAFIVIWNHTLLR